MTNNIVKILIADDHELFRKGLISLLNSSAKIKIIGEANNGKDLITKYLIYKPDVIIADISMPELSGIEAIKILHKSDDNIKVLFLSMYDGIDYIYHCIKSGGLGLVNKDISKTELLNAISVVAEGNRYFGDEYPKHKIEKILSDYEKQLKSTKYSDIEQLTEKESEILVLLAEGLTSNEIAEKLCISKRTVDTHRNHLIQKLGLKSSPQLIKYAIQSLRL